jgi:hypothetical protein
VLDSWPMRAIWLLAVQAALVLCVQSRPFHERLSPDAEFNRQIATKYCTISYRDDRTQDAQRLARYADRSIASMAKDFGSIDPSLMTDFECRILQYSQPKPGVADDATALSRTGGRGKWIEVSLLAESSISPSSRTLTNEPKDDDYTAKLIADELSTVLFERITRDKQKGWYFQDAPPWFVQGIEGYAGLTHSTVHNRKVTLSKYIVMVKTDPGEVYFDTKIHARNPYVGGLVFVTFLYRVYGKARVNELLASPLPSFEEAFAAEFGSLTGVERRYANWIRSTNSR